MAYPHPAGAPPSRVLGGGLGYGRRYGHWIRVRARTREQRRLLRSVNGEGDDLVDSVGTGREHDQPVDAQRDPGAVGQAMFHCGQQAVVHGDLGEVAIASGGEIGLESRPLLGRISELMVAVGELDAVDPGLESLGDGWRSGSDLRERSLRSREVVDKGRAAPRPSSGSTRDSAAGRAKSRGRHRDRGARRQEFGRSRGSAGCRVGIDTEAEKRLGVGQPLGAAGLEGVKA